MNLNQSVLVIYLQSHDQWHYRNVLVTQMQRSLLQQSKPLHYRCLQCQHLQKIIQTVNRFHICKCSLSVTSLCVHILEIIEAASFQMLAMPPTIENLLTQVDYGFNKYIFTMIHVHNHVIQKKRLQHRRIICAYVYHYKISMPT